MDITMLFLFVVWVVLVVAWVCYLTTTNKIIKEQDCEINELNATKKRLLIEIDESYKKGYTDGTMDALHGLEVEK